MIYPQFPGKDFLLFPHASFFALGIALYLLRAKRVDSLRYLLPMIVLNLGLAAVGAYINFWRVDMFDGVRSGPEVGLAVAMVSFGIVALAERLPVPSALAPTCITLGAVSYPLYLLHQDIGYQAIDAFAGSIGVQITRGVVIIAVFLISYIVFRYVERPVRPAMRKSLLSASERLIGIGGLRDGTEMRNGAAGHLDDSVSEK